MTNELAGRLALALAIGLLVGLERGWRERMAPDRSRTAGIRTYGISGLLGGVVAMLATAMNAPSVLIAGMVVFAGILALFKYREAVADRDYSVTAVMAGIAVFMLGALAVAGDYVLAAIGGAALAAVLASREVLHGLLRRMSWEELRAALILVVMTSIVMPILPDRTIDPWNSVNPRQIALFTILVAALSYIGYIAVKLAGPRRGLVISSLFGAIVSSTAVTVALARQAAEAPFARVGAAALAATVSICRVCVIVAALAPSILKPVALPALAAALVLVALGGLLLLRGQPAQEDGVRVKNPFDLAPLLGFAAGFAAVSAASAYLTQAIGVSGMIATSAVSGIFDVDVAVLSATRQLGAAAGTAAMAPGIVANSVLMALLGNAAGRCGLALVTGNWRFSLLYLVLSSLAAATGAAVYMLLDGRLPT